MKLLTSEHSSAKRTARATVTAVVLLGASALTGCVQVPIAEQRLVSKPNALFDDIGAFVYDAGPYPQSEPGSAAALASSGAGCTACR